ncbi:MAG: hypothetical protein QOF15_1472 [Mycobacterium sp.]|jgi:hypothetical protein|nr:hypothetical protein [Mycobacterium sp.]
MGSGEPNQDGSPVGLAFCRPDFGPEGKPVSTRSNFVRDHVCNIVWFRSHGRLLRRQ